MNPKRYVDPEEFIPERFEKFPLSTTEYVSSPDYMARDVYTFGAGRRVVSLDRQLVFMRSDLIPMSFIFSSQYDVWFAIISVRALTLRKWTSSSSFPG